MYSVKIVFISYPYNSAIIQYFSSKFAHMYLCGIHYQWLWPNCCKSNCFGDIDAMIWGNASCRPNGSSAWSRSLHKPSIHCGFSKAWGGDLQLSEHRLLAEIKYDAFVTSAHYWEFECSSSCTFLLKKQNHCLQHPSGKSYRVTNFVFEHPVLKLNIF